MYYHLVLTDRCNLRCTYCGAMDGPAGERFEVTYDLDDLAQFLEPDPHPVILFYGGEPTLRPDLMTSIMDRIPASEFVLQTNGTRLGVIPAEYLARMHTILISIDGRPDVTDHHRGRGTQARVLENVVQLRRRGFEGDLIARMVSSEVSSIEDEVVHLLTLPDDDGSPLFDHAHWQLDVMWTSENHWKDFPGWLEGSYKPGITALVKWWLQGLESGEIRGIVPFITIMNDLLRGRKTGLRCGSGLDTFAVMPRGEIVACPVCPEFEFNECGSIYEQTPKDLHGSRPLRSPCPECEVVDICGGRCLFTNQIPLWGAEGFDLVCSSVKHLITELREAMPQVTALMDNGVIGQSGFDYPEINNGCEIIP